MKKNCLSVLTVMGGPRRGVLKLSAHDHGLMSKNWLQVEFCQREGLPDDLSAGHWRRSKKNNCLSVLTVMGGPRRGVLKLSAHDHGLMSKNWLQVEFCCRGSLSDYISASPEDGSCIKLYRPCARQNILFSIVSSLTGFCLQRRPELLATLVSRISDGATVEFTAQGLLVLGSLAESSAKK